MNIFRKSCKLFFLGLCLTLAACGRESESENENGNEEANLPSPTQAVEDGGFSKKLNDGGGMGEGLLLEGKALGELTVVGKEDAVYCNLPENVVNWENAVPLCQDPLYGILYYVDYGGDFMIHAIYQGQSQIVAELPSKRLFCRGGKLYFLLCSYNQFEFEGASSGNIAEYDPITGKVRILSEKVFDSIVVYQDLIYCREEEKVEEDTDGRGFASSKKWFYFFDTETFVEQEQSTDPDYILTMQRYGKYFLAKTLEVSPDNPKIRTQTGTELRTWDGEKGTVWDGLITSNTSYVKDGSLCWRAGQKFHVLDLESREEQTFPMEEDVNSYIVVNGQILGAQNWLLKLENKKFGTWFSADERLDYIFEFYTDGKEVYAIAGHYSNDRNPVLRLVRMRGGVEHLDIAAGGYVTATSFSFLPIGE